MSLGYFIRIRHTQFCLGNAYLASVYLVVDVKTD